MALPKRKISKTRRDKRRTHQKVKPVNYVKCTQCGEVRLPHHMCPSCGTYNDRTVVEIEE